MWNRKRWRATAAATALFTMTLSAAADEFEVKSAERPNYKAVFAQVESKDIVPARARIGGTIISLAVEAGSSVKAGDVLAVVVDDKLVFQLEAIAARTKALEAELANAKTELARVTKLVQTGVAPKNRLDQAQTQVNVLANQIAAAGADRSVLEQQQSEGSVLAPSPGRILSVPVTKGSVVLPGEAVARIAGGGYFLRLSLPERHAAHIKTGDSVLVGGRGLASVDTDATTARGAVAKVYPEIEGGRVLADVEVEGLGDFFVGERTRVWIPVGTRSVISVPEAAVTKSHGIDYVRIAGAAGEISVPVIAGAPFEENGQKFIEILTGLSGGDKVVTP
jgi:RND family efflux transporter MFP subunit